MIIVQPASDRNGILHPPSNYQKKDEKTTNTAGQRVHDASKSDTETKLEEQTTPIASTDNFNVRKIDTKKKNYKTSVIDGFYDDRIDTLETQNNVKSVVEDQPIDATTDSELSLKIGVAQCRNTKQGAEYITDSLGYVCSIMHVDPKTQCCKHIDDEQARKDGLPPVERYSCSTCHTNQCCSSYEHCVSCCMDIEKRDDLKRLFQQWKDEKLFKGVKTVFELCLLRCRTTSKSVQNENRYKDSRYRYCYGSIN